MINIKKLLSVIVNGKDQETLTALYALTTSFYYKIQLNCMDNSNSRKDRINNEINKRGNEIKKGFNEIINREVEEPTLMDFVNEVKDFSYNYRTALTSLCCEAVEGNPKNTILTSILVNLVNAGFTIHDDIMDNSFYKRFSPTFFGKHGRDYSLTFGDYLVIKILAVIGQMVDSCSKEKTIRILNELGRLYTSLIEGELMEINSRRNLDVDLSYYHSMMWKISNDGEACAKLGGIIGNGTQDQVSSLANYGKILGYLWRLHDEIEDTLNLNAKLASRLRNESIPLPILYAAKSSTVSYNLIKPIIEQNSLSKSDIEILLNECFKADSFIYANNLSKEYYAEAVNNLSTIKDSEAKQLLELLLEDIIEKIGDMCV